MGPGDDPLVLIVEDQMAMARALADYVEALASVRLAATACEALDILESGEAIIAAIVDVSLPDGNGLDVIARVRPRRPLLPVLVLTGRDAWDDVNRAFSLSARYLRKTHDAAGIARMVTSFILHALPDSSRAMAIVERFCDRYEMSDRQRALVRLYIQGCPRHELAATMGLSENTVKSHIRETLRKCDASSLDALCRQILIESLRHREREA